MEDELKKEIRRQFLVDWVSSASIDEIVAKLIENDERAKKINNALKYIDWHYDLGTKENVEFCLLRDRLLEILGDKE